MNEGTAEFEADRHPLDVVAEDFARSCRAGEHPSVSDYVQRHPELADELRDLLPSIAMMEKLKNSRRSHASAGMTMATTPRIERIGDFRIVREVGRGGMGVVYEAVQESLGRRVALKVLSSAATLDPTRLARFDQEARAAARLHHTNIVPVFGVAEQDGVHYYVMQLIEGQALGDIVKSLATGHAERAEALRSKSGSSSAASASPSSAGAGESWTPIGDSTSGPGGARFARYYWRWVARVGLQVAQALHYAHQQGVLHRDVKPANLMLDARGTVWVTDFGLAKVGDDSNVTRTGDIVGTLQYLAPEALKKRADLRSDIYGLGLTLHEMLTFRPPYGDSHPAELIRRISTTDPPRPRSINPGIPRDLETIVLKAVSRDPDHRYQTAAEMAADLEAFLEDRPIRARRARATERLWRWCRRNRAVASLSAAAIVLAMVAIVVGWVGYVNTRKALAGESNRRNEAEFATRRAEQNVQLSLQAFEEIFNQVSQQEALQPQGPPPRRNGNSAQARQSTVDATLLQSVLDFYDRFAQQNATNPALNAEAARSYRRVGTVYRWLGEDEKADQAHERSAAMYEGLLALDPKRRDYARGLAEAASALPYSSSNAAGRDRQIARLRWAIAILETSGEQAAAEENRALARAFHSLGSGLRLRGETGEAETCFRHALEINAHLPPPDRPGPPPGLDRAEVTLSLAALLSETSRDNEARQLLRETIDDIEQDRGPRDGPGMRRPPRPFPGDVLGRLYEALAGVHRKLGEDAAAVLATQQAIRAHASAQRPDRDRHDGPPDDRRDGRPEGPPFDGPPDGRPPRRPGGPPPE